VRVEDYRQIVVPILDEFMLKSYQWVHNRCYVDESLRYSLIEVLDSKMFISIIRQRLVDGQYKGLGLSKISMSDGHYSIMNNEKVSGEISEGGVIKSYESRSKQSIEMTKNTEVIFLDGKLTIAQKMGDKLRQGVNLSKGSVGQSRPRVKSNRLVRIRREHQKPKIEKVLVIKEKP